MGSRFTPAEKLTAGGLADLLGISERRVKELRAAGVLPGAAGERYEMRDCVRAYCRHLRPSSGSSAAGGADVVTLNEARIAVLTEQATKLRAENDLVEGSVVRVEDVARAVGERLATIRTRLLAIPAGYAAQFARTSTPQGAYAVLEEVIAAALRDLSQGVRTGVAAVVGALDEGESA